MLSLTKKTSYGLIAMSHLATLEVGRVASAREIAATFGVPTALLMNVLKELAAAGYVESARGAHGGYRLARAPEEINLADLVAAMEGPIRASECLSRQGRPDEDGTCAQVDRCPVAGPVHRIHRKLRDFLKTLTLADIVPGTAGTPLPGGRSPLVAGVG
jgi:Rrf2 family protein